MFEETLVRGAKDILAALGRSDILRDAYLAGGTAAALQLGHRLSVDFDFFTDREFIPKVFAANLSKLGSFSVDEADKGTVLGVFKGVKFSLFSYKYPLIFPALNYSAVRIADIRDIAAMKIDAIASRGAKRDFVDLYFICGAGYTLEEILKFYHKKYGKAVSANIIHIQKSLVFFNDAEPERMPKMLKEARWQEIKRYFEREIKKLAGK
ncbi:MAG: nucleotidyl transferase AbiEii/AbiGii toxin family protein [Candidatus Omnitrophica bacterium]|nr:nucleotidyl transferase AbiEii/AbiGii toxin family protein [Candidatus Omnitrophota bacterium]